MTATCAYDVYTNVYRRISELRRQCYEPGLLGARANIDALQGASRIAAGLAACDADAERPPRARSVLCRAVCEATDCIEYPRLCSIEAKIGGDAPSAGTSLRVP